jgi:hypothetical protein
VITAHITSNHGHAAKYGPERVANYLIRSEKQNYKNIYGCHLARKVTPTPRAPICPDNSRGALNV